MTKKHTYTAIAPDGTEFTRRTARIYTHAVLYQLSEGHDLASCLHLPSVVKRNFEYYRDFVTLPEEALIAKYSYMARAGVESPGMHAERLARYRDRSRACLLDTLDWAEYQERYRARERADHNTRVESGYFDKWREAGFCGSPVLADRLYSSMKRKPHIAAMTIVEAVIF